MLVEVATSEPVLRTTVAQVELTERQVEEAKEHFGGDYGKYIVSTVYAWDDYSTIEYQPIDLPLGIGYDIEYDILETP